MAGLPGTSIVVLARLSVKENVTGGLSEMASRFPKMKPPGAARGSGKSGGRA